MSELATIRFRSKAPSLFSGQTGVVDFDNKVIRGVSCITGECEAEGHSLYVDDTTLKQLHELSKDMGQVPVTVNHDGGVEDVNGWLENFRLDGNKLRADWVLLDTHKETPTMLERAQRQPSTFGLSFAFKGDPKGVTVGTKQCARAEKVMSCDVVKRAAANKDGLFSAREVDMKQNVMPDPNPSQQQAEPTMADLFNAINQLNGRVDQMAQVQDQLVGHINQDVDDGTGVDRDFLEALNNASDEELAAYNQENGSNITREDINAAVAEFNSSLEGQSDEGQEGYEGQQPAEGQAAPEGAAAPGAAAPAAAGASAGAAFNALHKELIQLKAKVEGREKREIQFAKKKLADDIKNDFATLSSQNEELVKFAEKVVAENEALQLCVRTGTRPVKAGVDNGVRLFAANGSGELHPFQQRIKALVADKTCKSLGEAIQFASKENPAMHTDWLQSSAPQTLHA